MSLLIGSFTLGLILSLLALGILISFRVVAFEDLTVDGSLTLGGATAAALIVADFHPLVATLLACGAGACAGAITALLHTKCGVNRLLSGILVMTALYSVNLRIMGKSNIPLLSANTLLNQLQDFAARTFEGSETIPVWQWEVRTADLAVLISVLAIAASAAAMLHIFFRTNIGLAMRAIGDNSQMIRALGVDVGWMTVFGLFIANGLIAFSGALLAQYQGFADVQMGIGMLVWGLASVILGESLVGTRKIGYLLTGAIMGSVLFRLLVAIALRWGLNPNDLKLVTAVFVFAALVLPRLIGHLNSKLKPTRHA